MNKNPHIKVSCMQCEVIFEARQTLSKRNKYCSRKCHYISRQNKVEISCAYCKNIFLRTKSDLNNSKSGLRFCSKTCKCKAQRIGGIKEIMPPHYGTAKGEFNYRTQFELSELICDRCKYKEFPCAVEVHHIDKNRKNNSKTNLMLLCANCHRALHNHLWQ